MKIYWLFAMLLSYSVWIKGQDQKNLLPAILSDGKIDVVGLEQVYSNENLHWTAVRQGAGVTFSSGETVWDFSPFVYLVCEVQNLSGRELFVECHLDGDYWSTGAGYVPPRSSKKIETLILRKEYSEQQIKLFPKMNGLPGGATKLWCSYSPASVL